MQPYRQNGNDLNTMLTKQVPAIVFVEAALQMKEVGMEPHAMTDQMLEKIWVGALNTWRIVYEKEERINGELIFVMTEQIKKAFHALWNQRDGNSVNVNDQLRTIARTVGERCAKLARALSIPRTSILSFVSSVFSSFLQFLQHDPDALAELEALRVPVVEQSGTIGDEAVAAARSESTMTDAGLMKVKQGVLDIWKIVERQGGRAYFTMHRTLIDLLIDEIESAFERCGPSGKKRRRGVTVVGNMIPGLFQTEVHIVAKIRTRRLVIIELKNTRKMKTKDE
ncbi:hypothetical protein HK102_000466 [Quaeritorhiza haematococci]|nr:hypothetical protein HK102_000466 [Quaeritorhiza haematococci]